MGKWNRRYLPRYKYRPNYDYGDEDEYPPTTSNNPLSQSSRFDDNRVPSWEIDYCNSMKVPWRRVLASKKYIYSYPMVLNWDASAGKEALDDAKQRYWAAINGVPCDRPLPDPDMYLDEIDWNPFMDPELMADLDLQVFDPDDMDKVDGKLETIDEEVEATQAQSSKDQFTDDNPWESNNVRGTVSTKDAAQGWSMWDDSVNLMKSDDPWEQSCKQLADPLKDSAWGTGNESWGPRQDGGRQRENNSWSWSHGNNNTQRPKDFGNSGNSWKNDVSTGLEAKGWKNNTSESWGRRESEYQGNESKRWDSRRFSQGGTSFRGSCRKRESSTQHTSKYKSSRSLEAESRHQVLLYLYDGPPFDESFGGLQRRAWVEFTMVAIIPL